MSVRPRLAVLALLAAGGTAFGGYYLWPTGRHIASCAPNHAPVPAAAQKVLAGYAHRIEHSVDRSDRGTRSQSWSDPDAHRLRELSYDHSGQIESAFGVVTAGRSTRTTLVMYRAKKWTTKSEPVFPDVTENAAATVAQTTRDDVASGKAAVVGHAVVDGRDSLHLRELRHLPKPVVLAGTVVPKALSRSRLLHIDVWVDPLTYLPLRTRTSSVFGSSVSDTTWLPRTAANIAKTRLAIPQGYKRETDNSFSFEYAKDAATRCAHS